MLWEIIKVAIGIYVGLVIAAKNPTVAEKMKSLHDKVVSWAYMWLPRLIVWIYNFIKDRL